MDQPTEVIDPIILIFLFLVFSIGAIGPVVFCVWGAKRAETERLAAARVEATVCDQSEVSTDASNENAVAGNVATLPIVADLVPPTPEKAAVNA